MDGATSRRLMAVSDRLRPANAASRLRTVEPHRRSRRELDAFWTRASAPCPQHGTKDSSSRVTARRITRQDATVLLTAGSRSRLNWTSEESVVAAVIVGARRGRHATGGGDAGNQDATHPRTATFTGGTSRDCDHGDYGGRQEYSGPAARRIAAAQRSPPGRSVPPHDRAGPS